MKQKKLFSVIALLSERLCSILPMFFWLFLIFGFEEPLIAIITVVSALLHECGHIGYILWRRGRPKDMRATINGFRIKKNTSLSYGEEICLYLSGPAVNLLLFIVASLLTLVFGEICYLIAVINLATALSNLIPIEGYDGYGAIIAYLHLREESEAAERLISGISTALIFLLTLLSLYFIDRLGGGYWIFAVFFVSTLRHMDQGLVK